MKLKIREQTDNTIKITLSEASVSFANSLRRVLLSEIPTLSIDMVEIEKNYTVLPDEMIAHRLGLIPIYSGDALRYKEECMCTSHCSYCAIVGTLDVYNSSSSTRFVTSRDIKFEKENVVRTKNPVLIAKLSTNQSLKMSVIVRKGTGKIHAKWCPVTAVGFEYDRENKTRETEYWCDGDVDREWPMYKQAEPDILSEVRDIDMEIEVVEGVMEPAMVLRSALCILKEKVDVLARNLEAEGYQV